MSEPKGANHVADYLLLNSKTPLTALHVNKLAFFSHGWVLGKLHRPLAIETVEAWKYGPVFPSIYHAFKHHGSMRIECSTLSINNEEYKSVLDGLFDKDEKSIMDNVIKTYSVLPGSELIDITHMEGSPWHQYYDPNRFFVEIPNQVIEEYYSEE